MGKFIDRTGHIFGSWTLLTYLGASRWVCRCTCGAVKERRVNDLVRGKSTSCGCMQAELCRAANTQHGMTDSPEHKVWQHMRGRCLNPTNHRYPLYGGRGVTICDRWLESFQNFYADMGPRPEGTSLDRINNAGNYEPGNCRWADQRTQVHNSSSLRLTDDDVRAIRTDTRSLTAIAAEYGTCRTYICSVRNYKRRGDVPD